MKISITAKPYPDDDPGARWTGLVNNRPRIEFSVRDYKLWSRQYGAPRKEPWRPISYESPYTFVRLTDRQLMRKCRLYMLDLYMENI